MKQDALVAVARAVFEAAGGAPIDPDYVLPADIPLELSGEAVRARLCVFQDYRGAEMAMRPDLTLPVAQREAARREAGEASPKTYTYAARAFRIPVAPDDQLEFTQVGLERFGYEAGPAADADLFALVHRAVEACGVQPSGIVMGDLTIFPAFIDALGLPGVTTDLLKRAFRQEGGVRAVLDAAARPLDTDVARALDAADPEAALGDVLTARNIPLAGARSVAEIVEGLEARRAAIEAGGLTQVARDTLLALREVDVPLVSAAAALSEIASAHGLSGAGAAIAAFGARAEAILARVPQAEKTARFRTGFGRRFTYYDGFVFEIMALGLAETQPVAAGGRYDGLLAGLSAGRASATGVGGVVRPDRMVRVRRVGE
ncbi:ATP phosphoribosyltransferase regulatory subunit [Hyphomonas sp. WL0036]|uniref:ATP phosphoribosyltransferase regulatory subunit n=1 Tax=Hyphomonas sediminis TaxID=2866160 RepID=UPI001C8278E0|nr:ATP phosphoribosyltransferase regulatory subunit [Hyphomonas sediminis]MBY9065445.1 ATP phosphoribosyltransferase regulatory subunit [Hyphomonas sediminis]